MYPGSLAADQGVHPHEVSGVGAQAADRGICPPGVSVVGAQSADLGACNGSSGERGGCLFRVHSPRAEGGGVQEAKAAVENSLNSH